MRFRRDDGIVIPLFALVLVLLLVMVAFAIDLGATAERRRASQNTADAAALAAAQELGARGAKFASEPARTTARTAAEAAAKTYVQHNIGLAPTDPTWASCADTSALAVVGTSPCISFSSDLTQVRVRLPDETVDYQFAQLIGVPNGTVTASAVAEVVSAVGGSTRPILLRSGVAGINCVEAGGGGPATPCLGARLASGDFGSMTSPRYRVVTGGEDDANFALGLDHMLQLGATDGRNYCDADGSSPGGSGLANKCSSQVSGLLNDSPSTYDLANYVFPDSGGELKDVTVGLLGDGGGNFAVAGQTITALLFRPDGAGRDELVPPGSPATPTATFPGEPLPFNGVHISRFFLPGTAATVGCTGPIAPATDNVMDPDWDDCNSQLSAYIIANNAVPTSGPIFSRAIIESPRFGVAPVTDTALSGSSTWAKVVDFYGIYIDRIYGNPSGKVKSIQAFVFPLRMIEPSSVGGGVGLPYLGGPFGVRLIR